MAADTTRLAEIQTRAATATEGPWYVEAHQPTLTRRVVSDNHMLDANLGYLGNSNQAEAEFIAHARADVPWLIEQLRQRDAEIEELRTKLAVRERQLEDMDAGAIA